MAQETNFLGLPEYSTLDELLQSRPTLTLGGTPPKLANQPRATAPPLPAYTPAPNTAGNENPSLTQNFTRALDRGWDTTQMLVEYGLGSMFEALGWDEWADARFKEAQGEYAEIAANPAEVPSYTDIDGLGSAITYLVEGAGEMLPMLATTMGIGTAGGMAAKQIAKPIIAKKIEQQIAQRASTYVAQGMTKDAAKQKAVTELGTQLTKLAAKLKSRAALIGQGAGAYAGSLALETGGIAGEQYQRTGKTDFGTSLAFGSVAAALDVIPQFRLFKKAAGPVASAALGGRLVTRLGKEGAKQFFLEGSTEAMQTVIEKLGVYAQDQSLDLWSPEMWDEVIDAGLKGGAAGAGVGAVFEGVFGNQQQPGTTTPGAITPPPTAGGPLPGTTTAGQFLAQHAQTANIQNLAVASVPFSKYGVNQATFQFANADDKLLFQLGQEIATKGVSKASPALVLGGEGRFGKAQLTERAVDFYARTIASMAGRKGSAATQIIDAPEFRTTTARRFRFPMPQVNVHSPQWAAMTKKDQLKERLWEYAWNHDLIEPIEDMIAAGETNQAIQDMLTHTKKLNALGTLAKAQGYTFDTIKKQFLTTARSKMQAPVGPKDPTRTQWMAAYAAHQKTPPTPPPAAAPPTTPTPPTTPPAGPAPSAPPPPPAPQSPSPPSTPTPAAPPTQAAPTTAPKPPPAPKGPSEKEKLEMANGGAHRAMTKRLTPEQIVEGSKGLAGIPPGEIIRAYVYPGKLKAGNGDLWRTATTTPQPGEDYEYYLNLPAKEIDKYVAGNQVQGMETQDQLLIPDEVFDIYLEFKKKKPLTTVIMTPQSGEVMVPRNQYVYQLFDPIMALYGDIEMTADYWAGYLNASTQLLFHPKELNLYGLDNNLFIKKHFGENIKASALRDYVRRFYGNVQDQTEVDYKLTDPTGQVGTVQWNISNVAIVNGHITSDGKQEFTLNVTKIEPLNPFDVPATLHDYVAVKALMRHAAATGYTQVKLPTAFFLENTLQDFYKPFIRSSKTATNKNQPLFISAQRATELFFMQPNYAEYLSRIMRYGNIGPITREFLRRGLYKIHPKLAKVLFTSAYPNNFGWYGHGDYIGITTFIERDPTMGGTLNQRGLSTGIHETFHHAFLRKLFTPDEYRVLLSDDYLNRMVYLISRAKEDGLDVVASGTAMGSDEFAAAVYATLKAAQTHRQTIPGANKQRREEILAWGLQALHAYLKRGRVPPLPAGDPLYNRLHALNVMASSVRDLNERMLKEGDNILQAFMAGNMANRVLADPPAYTNQDIDARHAEIWKSIGMDLREQPKDSNGKTLPAIENAEIFHRLVGINESVEDQPDGIGWYFGDTAHIDNRWANTPVDIKNQMAVWPVTHRLTTTLEVRASDLSDPDTLLNALTLGGIIGPAASETDHAFHPSEAAPIREKMAKAGATFHPAEPGKHPKHRFWKNDGYYTTTGAFTPTKSFLDVSNVLDLDKSIFEQPGLRERFFNKYGDDPELEARLLKERAKFEADPEFERRYGDQVYGHLILTRAKDPKAFLERRQIFALRTRDYNETTNERTVVKNIVWDGSKLGNSRGDKFKVLREALVAKGIDGLRYMDQGAYSYVALSRDGFESAMFPSDPGIPVETDAGLMALASGTLQRLAKKPIKTVDETGHLSDLSLLQKFFVTAKHMAHRFPGFNKVFMYVQDRAHYRQTIASHALVETLTGKKRLAALQDLSKEGGANVMKAAELGRHLDLKNLQKNEQGLYEVTHPLASPIDGLMTQPGETVVLTAEEGAALDAMSEGFTLMLKDLRESVLLQNGFATNITTEELTKLHQDLQAARATIPDTPGLLAQFDVMMSRLQSVINWSNELEGMMGSHYVPFVRFGERAISVKQRRLNDRGEEMWDLIRLETFETTGLHKLRWRQKVSLRRQELMAKYAGSEYRVSEPFELTWNNIKDEYKDRIWVLDALSSMLSTENQENYKKVKEELLSDMHERGFPVHLGKSRNIPGYSTDIMASVGKYVASLSNYAADLRFYHRIKESVNAIDGSRHGQLKKYSQGYVDYALGVQNELTWVRNIGFLSFLGFNPSSAILQFGSLPMFTAPYLGRVMGLPSAYKELGRNMAKMASLTLKGKRPNKFVVFNPASFDKLGPGVKEGMLWAWERGYMAPMITMEQAGLDTSNRAWRATRLGRGLAWITNASALMFNTAETLSRATTILTVLEQAYNNPNFMKRFNEEHANDQRWQSFVEAGQNHPLYAAIHVVEQTFGVYGKEGRAPYMRGAGAAVFQFMTYPQQMIELMARMVKADGVAGKKAFAVCMIMLLLVGGLQGLPGAENLKDTAEFVYRKWTGVDLDLETEARAMLAEMTGSQVFGEVFMRGVLDMSGIAAGRRLAMGNLPALNNLTSLMNSSASGLELLGVPGSILASTSSFPQVAQEQGLLAAFKETFAPTAFKNLYDGLYKWPKYGVTRPNGDVVIQPENLDDTDFVLKALGFNSSKVAQAREGFRAATRAGQAVRDLQSRYYDELAIRYLDMRAARKLGDAATVAEMRAEIQDIRQEIAAHNKTAPSHEKVKIDQDYLISLVNRRERGLVEVIDNAPKKARKQMKAMDELYNWRINDS